ncbi:MAG: glycosyltransferase [Bacteroidota bacterium]|nr:glycosyltransferase [Bacteroidota bacterium]
MLNSLTNLGFNPDILIYDNSPDIQDAPLNNQEKLNIIYVADKLNGGVSKAYNYAATIAGRKKKWLLLFDQDTFFPTDFIQVYIKAIQKNPTEKLFAPVMLTDNDKIISPCVFKLKRGFYGKDKEPGIYSLKNRSLINCGLCINLLSFRNIGGYNEKIKLDFSDHDFVSRFNTQISDRFVLIDLKVKHQLSTALKNTLTADIVRFDYYLEGASQFSSSFGEATILNINALLRALKLGVVHKRFIFIKKFVNHSLGRNA